MKIIFVSLLALLLGAGCQKNNKELVEKIAKLEERIVLLEKKLTAQAPAQPPAQPEQTAAYSVPVGKSYIWGNPNAPITLARF